MLGLPVVRSARSVRREAAGPFRTIADEEQMRGIRVVALLLATAASPALAQRVPRVKIDSTPDLNVFLRARGDTLWFTPFAESIPGKPRSSTTTVIFRDSGAVMIVNAEQLPMPPELVRIYRFFLQQARECPNPVQGCELDHALLP